MEAMRIIMRLIAIYFKLIFIHNNNNNVFEHLTTPSSCQAVLCEE